MLIIPIFVPHAGCPHDCCFCNQKVISGRTSIPTKEDIIGTIEMFRTAAERYNEVQIAFYGGSFTAVETDLQLMFLETVQPYLKANGGFVDTLRLSTRPDCIDENVLMRLKEYNVTVVELGAQSMDDKVLDASGRGHTSEDTAKAAALLKKHGFTVGIQTMTGLPSATEKSDLDTAKAVCLLVPAFVRIYPTIVVKETALSRSFSEGTYRAQKLEDAVSLCVKLSDIYESAGIPVIRMGLQSSDNISRDGDVMAGPYHEAFGQLVQSKRMLNRIIDSLDNYASDPCKPRGFKEFKSVIIYVEKTRVSDCIGQNRMNAEILKEKYGFINIKVRPKDAAETRSPGVYRDKKPRELILVI